MYYVQHADARTSNWAGGCDTAVLNHHARDDGYWAQVRARQPSQATQSGQGRDRSRTDHSPTPPRFVIWGDAPKKTNFSKFSKANGKRLKRNWSKLGNCLTLICDMLFVLDTNRHHCMKYCCYLAAKTAAVAKESKCLRTIIITAAEKVESYTWVNYILLKCVLFYASRTISNKHKEPP